MFAWLRTAVRSAIIAGIQDAINDVQGQGGSVPDTRLLLEYRDQSAQVPTDAVVIRTTGRKAASK